MTITTTKTGWVERVLWLALAAGASGMVLGGCAHDRVKPDDMSAAAHVNEAQREYAAADREYKQYDPRAGRRATVTSRGADGTSEVTFNPTQGHLDAADRLAKHAEQHLAAASELERYANQECKPFEPAIRAACPALGPIAAVEDIRGGVRLRLAPNMPIEAVLAHMRCHLAFAREHGWQPAPDCPLYLKGVDIRRSADGAAIELIARDGKTTDELRRRARAEVNVNPAI
jgi:hypothetical protein